MGKPGGGEAGRWGSREMGKQERRQAGGWGSTTTTTTTTTTSFKCLM